MIAKRNVAPVRKAAFRVCKGRIFCASAIRHVDAIGRYPPHSERGRMAALRARYGGGYGDGGGYGTGAGNAPGGAGTGLGVGGGRERDL